MNAIMSKKPETGPDTGIEGIDIGVLPKKPGENKKVRLKKLI